MNTSARFIWPSVLLAVCGFAIAAEHESLPLVRIMASPAQFDKKLLTASGVLGQDTDARWMLFLDCDSARAKATQNAVLLRSGTKLAETLSSNSMSYVLASGEFSAGDQARLNVSGEIALDAIRPYPLLRELSPADKDMNIRCNR